MSRFVKQTTGKRFPDGKYVWSDSFHKKGETVPGSFIFGPKFGAFHQNLNGVTKYVTADKWWTRMVNRWLGNLVAPDRSIIEGPTGEQRPLMREAVERVAQRKGVPVSSIQANLWFYEQKLYRMLGGEGVESFHFGDAADKWLKKGSPHRLARFDDNVVREHGPSLSTSPTTTTGVAAHAHDIMADRLEELGDPRAALVRGRFSVENPWNEQSHRVLGTRRPQIGSAMGTVHLPDGTYINTHSISNPNGSKRGYVVTWVHKTEDVNDEEPLPIRSYGTMMTPEEYAAWHATVDPEHHKYILPPPTPRPTKQERPNDSLVYAGTRVPGAQPAFGFWSGGKEESSIVRAPAAFAERTAKDLGAKSGQKTVLWFTPGTGPDLLHVMHSPLPPDQANKILSAHGVEYKTIVPHGDGSVIHVVDQGGELSDAVKAYASDSSSRIVSKAGTAGFAEIGPTKLARPNPHKWETTPSSNPELRQFFDEVRLSQHTDHGVAGALGDWLEEHNDWRHHLLRRTAEVRPEVGGESWERADGVSGFRTHTPTATHPASVYHEPGTHAYAPPLSTVHARPHDDKVFVTTRHPTHRGTNTIRSLLTRPEYEAMREDAATAGVHFPAV